MSSVLDYILSEWEAGDYDGNLAETYSNFLLILLDATEEERRDPRLLPFLEAGYEAYVREAGSFDSQPEVAHDMALALIGADREAVKALTPPRPARALWRPFTPSPPTSPQRGGGAKRPRSPEPEAESKVQPEIEILQTRERHLRRFKTVFREETAVVKGLGESLPNEEVMVGLFDTLLTRQREAVSAKDDDRVIFEIENGERVDNPLWFSMRRVDQLNGRIILDKLSRVLNSNESFMVQGQLKLSYIHIPTPEVGGARDARLGNESIDQWLARKVVRHTIFSPSNRNDQMCLARAVVVAKAKKGLSKHAFSRLKNADSVVQTREAQKICDMAGIDPNQPCGVDEVKRVQDALPGYRICVFTDQKGRECVFKGEYAPGVKNIYLLLHGGHFHAIIYPRRAFDYNHECEQCVVFYNNKGEHQCAGSCWRCLGDRPHNNPGLPLKRCAECGHQFAGDECFDNHKHIKLPNTDQTKCSTFKFCQGCETSYSNARGRQHICGFVYCKYCKMNVRENHLCFMQPWSPREKKEKYNYCTVWYDIETTQHTEIDGKPGVFEHRPNLLVSQAVCDNCAEIQQNDYFCTVCKTRQQVFHNLDDPNINVISQFINYLQSFPAKTEVLIIAHNAKAFDGVFILQELIARKMKPELILQGAKIISMTISSWKFIDSLMFLPMPLASFPKAFGLNELKKGYFPFLANKPANYTYVGPLLERDLYCVSGMKAQSAITFNKWYDDQVEQGYEFDFRKELIEYCISDVTILRQGCQAFRKVFAQTAGFDPMFNCLTLSSACMAAYRLNFLPENTIGLVPAGGYHGRGKQSHAALQWLDYEAHKLGRKISTIYTDREISVLGRRVDGYVEIPLPQGGVERRIYQFHGDYWHQCPKHFPAQPQTGENRFERTVRITSLFRNAGYTVVEKWECDWKLDLQDAEVKAYFEAHPTTRSPPLDLRKALCGGRTSALRWYHKADLEKGEKIKMADVISEYPGVQLRGKYPVGHPSIFLEGDGNIPALRSWNGVVKCTVLPPRDLFLPVLPYKCSGKLLFPLCRTCAETENTEICQHTPLQRQLTGEWCAPELLLAILEKGYTVVNIHEVHQYPGTKQFDVRTGEDGLFSGYVRRFMALKVQASGWPADCTTQEQRDLFMADVKKHDGIIIDPSKVEKNPGLRTLAKLCLNSMWGKLSEVVLRPKTELLYSYDALMQIVTDPTKEVSALVPLSDDCLQVTYKPVADSEESLPTSSVVHGVFTTALGRLQLYQYLDIVKDRALYHDTDSVAYISRPGEPDLPLGTHLGQLTDQIEEDYGPGSFITEFAAGGPKNYGFKVAVGGDLQNIKVCIKVRGISINSSCDALVTFDNLKSMVMGDVDKLTVPIPRQIVRLPGWRIVTRATSKQWQAKNTKRRRVDMARTVPHGYNAFEEDDEEDQALLEVMDFLGDS